MQSRKLAGYLLNRDHAKGRSKAKFFERELGITSPDSDFLQSQLIDALRAAPLIDVRLDGHGIRFGALLPVKGRNGRTATIETAWIVRSGERASLVTAFPGVKDDDLELQAQSPALVPETLQGTARWQAIFDLASDVGKQAAAHCVPTPMKIAGGELIMEANAAALTSWSPMPEKASPAGLRPRASVHGITALGCASMLKEGTSRLIARLLIPRASQKCSGETESKPASSDI